MGSPNMTLRTNTLISLLSLLSLLATVSAHPGGYWWMGQDGAFGSQSNNNQIVDNSPSPSPSPALELLPGGGYYGSSNQHTEDFSSSSSSAGSLEDLTPSPSLPVVFEEPEDLPVTECPVGWKCVSELFCDATATMVSQRVQLSKAQVAIRGNLIQCMNPATAQFNVCCRQPQLSPQVSLSPAVPAVPDLPPADPERIQFEAEVRPGPSQGFCPVISVLPPIQLCANRKSTCWSAGLPDVDCLDNALCCFDGCANVCLGRGPVAGNPGPQTNPRQTTPAPVNIQENFAESLPSNLASNTVVSSPQVSTKPPPGRQPVINNSPASAQPFVRCPSAMKCVPKVNCDFNGVMVNTRVSLSPIQEQQRVPLIPCLNSARGNNVDVCCRDPNYKDPWPEMNTKNTKKNSKNVVKKSPGQPNIAINQRVSRPQQPLNKPSQPLSYGR